MTKRSSSIQTSCKRKLESHFKRFGNPESQQTLEQIRIDRTHIAGSINPVNPVTINKVEQIHAVDGIAEGRSHQPRSALAGSRRCPPSPAPRPRGPGAKECARNIAQAVEITRAIEGFGRDGRHPAIGWRCRESRANPSPPNSLLNREKTGNFRKYRPRIADSYGLSG